MSRWHWNVRPEPEAVRDARRDVVEAARSGVADDCGWADYDAIALGTSELVSNALQHGASPIQLAVDTDGGTRVRVEVTDADPSMPVVLDQPRDSGGRGLDIVRSLSSAMGWQPAERGKTVWFEVSQAAAPSRRDTGPRATG